MVPLGGLLPISGKHGLGQPSLARRFSSSLYSTHRPPLLRWSSSVVPSAFASRRHCRRPNSGSLAHGSLAMAGVSRFRVPGFRILV